VGGDGFLSEIINGMAFEGRRCKDGPELPLRIPLHVVPEGTGKARFERDFDPINPILTPF